MSIKKQLQEDMKQAMKSGDKKGRDIIRMMISRIQNKEIELKCDANEVEVVALLQTFKKQTEEESLAYLNANNAQRHLELTQDIDLINKYLPTLMSEVEIKQFVSLKISELEAQGVSVNKGLVMKTVMPLVKGKADNALVMNVVNSVFA